MATYLESGLRVSLEEGRHFRFEPLRAYERLKGRHLKEIDFAWCEGPEDATELVLLEVKRYEEIDAGAAKRRPDVISDKITDALLFLLAIWARTSVGHDAAAEIPPCAAQVPRRLRVVVAVSLPASRKVHLLSLRDSLRGRLWGRLLLAEGNKPEIVDFEEVARRFPGLVKRAGTSPELPQDSERT